MNTNISKAVNILKRGGIIIFPTDTAFGIGCRIDKPEAVKKLFKIRKRPKDQAMPVLVDSLDMAREYAHIPELVVKKLIKPFWPGALTIVCNCRGKKVNKLIIGGGDTIGLRIPNSKDVLKIIKNTGVPITGSSANFHTEKTPFTFEDLEPELIKKADFVLNGICSNDKPSTVIDITQNPWKILRQGAIKVKIN
jgi:L-threonylcarbamoyladenylate synthase